MCGNNQTSFSEFSLLGFHEFNHFKVVLFCIFFVLYVVILVENCLIVTLVSTCHHLNVPMYIFLRNLALADLLLTSNIMPKMLQVTWLEGATISRTGCFMQYYFHCIATYGQSLIVTAMAYDRYLAICHPLRYSAVMNQKLCFHLSFWPWAIPTLVMPSEMFITGQQEFCNTEEIDHFFCDIGPIVGLASTDAYQVAFEDFLLTVLLTFSPFLLVIISYICIFFAIVKIASSDGRRKAFSTCSSHLATVCMYYGPLTAIYMFPFGETSPYENKLKSLLYTACTPLINPVLYSMRNKEIKKASQLLFCRSRV
ncbi:olfactory receptor 1500-like [Dendropsophus ebraccatus]|uniref:olfactory receptor 1500-like n=1 Tax=Dendropsophus ebraccatus TaxID=150705 RepID=UPI0038317577